MMKILMIGGTGTISSAITRQLAESDNELWLLNRGTHKHEVPASVKQIIASIDDEAEVLRQIGDSQHLHITSLPPVMSSRKSLRLPTPIDILTRPVHM